MTNSAHTHGIEKSRPVTYVRSCLLIFALAFTVFGCGSSEQKPGLDSQSEVRPDWTIQMNSTCTEASAENCVGAYTFSLGADGLYRVGPGPQGQILSGKLSDDEFKMTQKLYAELSPKANAFRGEPLCVSSPAESDVAKSTITVVPRSGDSHDWITTTPKETCFSLSTPEDARKLLDWVQSMAQKHYPLPFPDDACDNAIASLEALYGTVRQCKHDWDCTFFNDTFEPIPSNDFTFVTTGDCTGASPLVVGNLDRVNDKRSLLLGELAHARKACARRSESGCNGFSDFQPTRPAPVCSGGICRPLDIR